MENDEEKTMFNINPKRLRYILDLHSLSDENFLFLINENRKRGLISKKDFNQIINQEKKIDIFLLKRLDKIFEMGLSWYISERDLPEKKMGSIFFRKDKFNSELNLESRKKVNKFEELKFEIIALCNNIAFKPEKKIKTYDVNNDVKKIANEIREKFNEAEEFLLKENIIKKTKDPKEYLKNLIRIIEEFNIFVFEFVDRKQKDELKTKFDGFFINPNIIVIKRQQNYFKREIFTLMHEFAHCLLDIEEIDVDIDNKQIDRTNKIERWCYNFSYYFLIGEYKQYVEKLNNASKNNNYLKNEIDNIFNNTFLSYSSIYTQLLIENKILYNDYKNILDEINASVKDAIKRRKESQRIERERMKEKGEKPFGSSPKPIMSNLFREIVEINFTQGNVDRNDLRYYDKIFSSKLLSGVI